MVGDYLHVWRDSLALPLMSIAMIQTIVHTYKRKHLHKEVVCTRNKALNESSGETTLGEKPLSPLRNTDGPSCTSLLHGAARKKANKRWSNASNTDPNADHVETISSNEIKTLRRRMKGTTEINELAMK